MDEKKVEMPDELKKWTSDEWLEYCCILSDIEDAGTFEDFLKEEESWRRKWAHNLLTETDEQEIWSDAWGIVKSIHKIEMMRLLIDYLRKTGKYPTPSR